MSNNSEWDNLQNIHTAMYKDILANRNLSKHLEDITATSGY